MARERIGTQEHAGCLGVENHGDRARGLVVPPFWHIMPASSGTRGCKGRCGMFMKISAKGNYVFLQFCNLLLNVNHRYIPLIYLMD